MQKRELRYAGIWAVSFLSSVERLKNPYPRIEGKDEQNKNRDGTGNFAATAMSLTDAFLWQE
jgi:hypothetical protein